MKKVQVILVTLFLISAASTFGSYFQNNNSQVRDPWIQSVVDACKDVQAIYAVNKVKVAIIFSDFQGSRANRDLQFEKNVRITPSVHNDVGSSNKNEKGNV